MPSSYASCAATIGQYLKELREEPLPSPPPASALLGLYLSASSLGAVHRHANQCVSFQRMLQALLTMPGGSLDLPHLCWLFWAPASVQLPEILALELGNTLKNHLIFLGES